MLCSSGGLFDIRICCTHAMALVEGGKQEVETGSRGGYTGVYSHYGANLTYR